MNRSRRLSLTKAKELLTQALYIVETVRDQEQDCLDNIPENLQSSSRAEQMEDVISSLEEVLETMSSAQDELSNII